MYFFQQKVLCTYIVLIILDYVNDISILWFIISAFEDSVSSSCFTVVFLYLLLWLSYPRLMDASCVSALLSMIGLFRGSRSVY